jgi:hypothetical protein
MHKRFTKLILGGTLAVVVALIVAGTASARIASPPSQQDSTTSLLGYPKGVVGAPGLGTADSTPLTSLLGYPRGVVGAPGLETASLPVTLHVQKFASSYGDFPEVVRTMSLGNVAHSTSTSNGGGFDWSDAWIGVGVAIGVASIIGLLAFGIRRSKATPATA